MGSSLSFHGTSMFIMPIQLQVTVRLTINTIFFTQIFLSIKNKTKYPEYHTKCKRKIT